MDLLFLQCTAKNKKPTAGGVGAHIKTTLQQLATDESCVSSEDDIGEELARGSSARSRARLVDGGGTGSILRNPNSHGHSRSTGRQGLDQMTGGQTGMLELERLQGATGGSLSPARLEFSAG